MTQGTGGDRTTPFTSCMCVCTSHTHIHRWCTGQPVCLSVCLSVDGVMLLSALIHRLLARQTDMEGETEKSTETLQWEENDREKATSYRLSMFLQTTVGKKVWWTGRVDPKSWEISLVSLVWSFFTLHPWKWTIHSRNSCSFWRHAAKGNTRLQERNIY